MTAAGLRIASSTTLPIEYVTKTTGILAQRRKGKTYTASVNAEELVRLKMPFAALDPTGAWWGLRASADGKSAGLPVIIFGGQHGDVPLERTGGKYLADLVIDQPSYYVFDLSLFESSEAERQFATDFATRLYRKKMQPGNDFPMHLFVDEADRFVPQQSPSGDKTMLGAFEALVRRGGLHGIGTTLISQRSAVVNKNVLEQLDLLIVLRTVGPNDQDAIERIVKADGTKEQIATMMGSLASLALGEAWLWEPGEGLFRRVKIRERRTFNSSATPKPGEKRVEPRTFAAVDLAEIEKKLAATIERTQADDPKILRKQIAALEREIRDVRKEADAARAETRVETIEIPIIDADNRGLLVGLVDLATRIAGQTEKMASIAANIAASVDAVSGSATIRERRETGSPKPVSGPSGPNAREVLRPEPRAARPAAIDGQIGGAERKIVIAIETYGPMTMRKLALVTGYAMKGGGFRNALSRLRTLGLIEGRGTIELAEDLQ